MTVQELIDGLKHYDPNIMVRFAVKPETWGRWDTYYNIDLFDVEYNANDPVLRRPILLILRSK